jgi:hypothetical protein
MHGVCATTVNSMMTLFLSLSLAPLAVALVLDGLRRGRVPMVEHLARTQGSEGLDTGTAETSGACSIVSLRSGSARPQLEVCPEKNDLMRETIREVPSPSFQLETSSQRGTRRAISCDVSN